MLTVKKWYLSTVNTKLFLNTKSFAHSSIYTFIYSITKSENKHKEHQLGRIKNIVVPSFETGFYNSYTWGMDYIVLNGSVTPVIFHTTRM
jgi:hypothetical protein